MPLPSRLLRGRDVRPNSTGTRDRDTKRLRRTAKPGTLATQTQTLDQLVVALGVAVLEIVEKTAALADHLEQAAARMMILRVALEVLGEIGDAFAEDRDLHFRRTGVATGLRVRLDQLRLAVCRNRHRILLKTKG